MKSRYVKDLRGLALIVLMAGANTIGSLAQTPPKVIAFQAPASYNYTTKPSCLPPFDASYFSSFMGTSTQPGALNNISGIGVTVYWSCVDNCGNVSTPCAYPTTTTCIGGATAWDSCFNFGYLDQDLMGYITDVIGGQTPFSSKKIVLIIQPENDSGGVNTITPNYVFNATYAFNLNSNPQDMTVCPEWTGANNSSSRIQGPFGGIDNHVNFGIYNVNSCTVLSGSALTCCVTGCNLSDYSGFPVVYEKPIMSAYQNFLLALFKHYSPAGSGSGPQIAPYILYARIGMSHGGENYPICASNAANNPSCNDPPCSPGTMNSTWPGPLGQFPTDSFTAEPWQLPPSYSDAGYLTEWQTPSDGAGYTTAMMQFLNTHATVPVDIAASYGPPDHGYQLYANLESQIASQNNVGFGNEVVNIYDTVLAAAGSPATGNWVANFRNYPKAPIHHLQTYNPGNGGTFAAGFAINNIAISGSSATITCSGSTNCSFFCPGYIYVVGNQNPALNGIFPTANSTTCVPNSMTVVYTPTQPVSGGPYLGGVMWGSNYWPITMPFMTEQKVSSIEVYECDIDFAYGTTTTTGCENTAGLSAQDYENAVMNSLIGIPSGTSFHSDSFFNTWQF